MKRVTYRQLFSFFLPLAISPMFIGSTHTIVNAAMARLPFPELSLAIYAITRSITNIIKSPILMSRQVMVSFVDDRDGYYRILKFTTILTSFVFLILFLMGFTPFGGWVIKNIIGLTEVEQISFAYLAFRIMCFIPLLQMLRDVHQGIIIGLKKTNLMLPGVIIRVLIISLFLWWAVSFRIITGIAAGSAAWLIGMGLEALFLIIYLTYKYKSPAQAAERMPEQRDKDLSLSRLLKFFIPLGLVMSLRVLLEPIIQSGIARGATPTLSLAAYGVAWTLIAFLTGPLAMLYQCPLVYIDNADDPNWRIVFRFTLIVGGLVGLGVFFVGITPLGEWILGSLIGVKGQVVVIARQTILAFSIFPIIRAFRQAYWGLLMQRKTTTVIPIAKGANILVVTLFFAIMFLVTRIEAAVIGALAFTTGELTESLVIWYFILIPGEKDKLEVVIIIFNNWPGNLNIG